MHIGPISASNNNGCWVAYIESKWDVEGTRWTDHEDTDKKSKENYTYSVTPRLFYNLSGCAREWEETEVVTEAHCKNDRTATLDETRLDSISGNC